MPADQVSAILGLISAGCGLIAACALGVCAFALFKLSRIYGAKDR